MASLWFKIKRALGLASYAPADVLELAIKLRYYSPAPAFEKVASSGFMCVAVNNMYLANAITMKEREQTIAQVHVWLHHDNQSRDYLQQLFPNQRNQPICGFVHFVGKPFYRRAIQHLRDTNQNKETLDEFMEKATTPIH